MHRWSAFWAALAGLLMVIHAPTFAQTQVGTIRGVVLDADFDAPLPGAEVLVVETGARVRTGGQGNFSVAGLAPGAYTLIVSKEGYVRFVRTNVPVRAGELTDVEAALAGEYTELDEFVVQDLLQGGGGSEAALLALRLDSPALLDSVGAELMSRAGASDAAGALRLVSGASVQDGKFAVVRGLPDRYVSSQLNGVRLPSADDDKRAVELDQFPSAAVESVQVSKTFTPDQQGDASGGAVDVVLKSIPDEAVLQVSGQLGWNSITAGEDEFLSYDGGGVTTWGKDDGDHGMQPVGDDWDSPVGVSTDDAPQDYKWTISGGGKREIADGVRIGAFGSVFYERDSLHDDQAQSNALWVENPGSKPTPEKNQAAGTDDFKTALFDVTRSTRTVQWGTLGLVGIESERHAVGLTYLYTRTAEDTATLAIDTRGKQHFFPGYDPTDPASPGFDVPQAAPYLRTETLEYVERTTSSLQLNGRHVLPWDGGSFWSSPRFEPPVLSWVVAHSTATERTPDKRQFGALWTPGFELGGLTIPSKWSPYKPGANFNLGNAQHIFESIEEESDQGRIDLELPFERESGASGALSFGVFADRVDRTFDQDTFSNEGDNTEFFGEFDEPWSAAFPFEDGHDIVASESDVDYEGEQDIDAWYGMLELPLSRELSLIGGARAESTSIEVTNIPDPLATWFPPGGGTGVQLNPGDADVDFTQHDLLPSIGLAWEPDEHWTVRVAWSQTVARQTFKELTPIVQQEFLGGPTFIGNPELRMSEVDNYDLRADYRPQPGALLSASLFYKDITDVIEYVQDEADQLTYTTARNYPQGRLRGVEVEARQDLGTWFDPLAGLSLGANATLLDARVELPANEVAELEGLGETGVSERDMTQAPEYLFNLYATYDFEPTGTELGLFYTVVGDTLVAGAGLSKNEFVPNVYERSYGTLNLTLTQRLGRFLRLSFQAKNLLDPAIEEVYRYEGEDYLHEVSHRGIDFNVTLSARFTF